MRFFTISRGDNKALLYIIPKNRWDFKGALELSSANIREDFTANAEYATSPAYLDSAII